MKYMLLMNVPGGGPYQIAGWAAADITAHIAFMRGFVEKLAAAGELVWTGGLSGPDQAQARSHVTVAVPGATTQSTGFPDNAKQGGVWIMNAGTSAAHLMTPGS